MAFETRIDEIHEMDRSREFAEILVEMEPVPYKELLIAFDTRVDGSMPRELIDKDELQGQELFGAFSRCFDGALLYDFYDWPEPRGENRGYVYYMTDTGLDAFDLTRPNIPSVDEHEEFQYPRHRCDHENETRDDPRCEGSLCLDCGRVMVGSFQRGWVGDQDR